MATSYKTPGVYIEEIASLPASVAQVETAIPAFIGYTEFHRDTDGTDLLNTPTRIASLVEFREKFGGAPPLSINKVELNGVNQVTSIEMADQYYMFDAIRMFYSNGGGDCYIVPVGTYSDGVIQNGASDGSTQGFLTGLEALKRADEPTLLLAPDAVKMTQANVDTLYQAMLAHANQLQDRFCVFDLKENDGNDLDDAVADFRSGIGVNYLKYGAVYAPWIKANLPKDAKYKDVMGKIYQGGSAISALNVLADPNSAEAKFTADRLENLVDDAGDYDDEISALLTEATLEDQFQKLYSAFANETVSNNKKTALQALVGFYFKVIHTYDNWLNPAASHYFDDAAATYTAAGYAPSLTAGKTYLNALLADYVTNAYKAVAGRLLDWGKEANGAKLGDAVGASPALTGGFAPTGYAGLTWAMDASVWGSYFGTPPGSEPAIFAGANNLEKMNAAAPKIKAIWTDIKSGIQLVEEALSSLMGTIEQSAKLQIPTLKAILEKIGANLTTMPPSGAIVGIYAAVDRSRGVWKAPANVSLSATAGVQTIISHEKQENLNVDVVAGKSINAIRPFTGKGIIVWGARTLAGNDNEWRYVPVRRLYITVEESIKKATEFVVFEPNDANTWVRVKGMISNYLTELWKAGALAGGKPNQAFFVNVGLGETMTAQDILEGRMIIEIGLAAVRPAEFIILRFYHKLQEA